MILGKRIWNSIRPVELPELPGHQISKEGIVADR